MLALTGPDAGSQLKPMEADNVGEIILCFRACVREQCEVSCRASVRSSDKQVIATNKNKEADDVNRSVLADGQRGYRFA